jgi:hypothetical protein
MFCCILLREITRSSLLFTFVVDTTSILMPNLLLYLRGHVQARVRQLQVIWYREINARWIIAPPEFVESSCENIIEISLAIGVISVSRPPTTSVTLKPSRSVSVGYKSSNSYRVSLATSI